MTADSVLPPRQRSMRAVFDHSWRLLTGSEQQVLARLSVFRGGFNREGAQAVTGATLRQLLALVNHHYCMPANWANVLA